MNPVLIFRHVDCEGPGYLGEFLGVRNIPLALVRVDEGEPPPREITRCSGLVFMGGPMSVGDPLPWIDSEIELIREAHARGVPILGHCLGAQLISKALGGRIEANDVSEIGWYQVERLKGELADQWLGDLPSRFEVFHWHKDTFSLPKGATPILRSDLCRNQGFVLGKTLALQCHTEVTAKMVKEWMSRYEGELAANATGVQDRGEMTRALTQRVRALRRTADRIYGRWLQGIAEEPRDTRLFGNPGGNL